MVFQHILKGIHGITRESAERILLNTGIQCNWWREARNIKPRDIGERLAPGWLDRHLHQYEDHCGKGTPFISTTAGTAVFFLHEAEEMLPEQRAFPALHTAIEFATAWWKGSGFVYYGYVMTLGRPSLPLREFAEAVRDVHVYTGYSPYRHEGELVAKIDIPSVRLERVEEYGPEAKHELAGERDPKPRWVRDNPGYQPPAQYANVVDWM